MDNTIIQQGSFTSDGTAKILEIRSDMDWMQVINDTQWGLMPATGVGVKFEWQRGLAAGSAWEYTKTDSSLVLQAEKITSGGFTLINTDTASIGAAVTGTTITKANPPVCTANGHGYSNGDVVVLSNLVEMPQLGNVFFTIGSVSTNTFELTYMNTNTANFTQESAFEVRKVASAGGYTPGSVIITGVTVGTTTQVELANATHGITANQRVRFYVPSEFGMTELSGLAGNVTSVTSNVLTVDIDSSAFTAFAWPAASSYPFRFGTVTPFGTESGTSLADATDNTSYIGMELGAGIDGPAGASSDVIYWRAGKSFSVSNE